MNDDRNDIKDDSYDTLRKHIIFIGDYLSDGEKSSDDDDDPEIYFDQDDKHRWTLLCYRLDKVPLTYLINIIKKYREELLIKLDKETLEELCLYDEPESVFLSYRMDHTKNMRITINGFLPKKDFIFFVEILKQYSFKYDGLKKEWYLPYLSLRSLDTISYLIDLDEMGIESLPLPQVILDDNHIDNVIYNISNHLIADTMALKYFDDGKFSFYSTYSPIFNEILSNKSSILSGITEYNPNDHGRETYDISFVEEILEKLTKALPDFNIIVDCRIKKAREEHNRYIEELKKPIPKVHEKMAPGLSLFPYQNEGVRFLEQTGGNALIGDEMGLGKTIQTLAWVAMHNKKALVIAPKVVRRNWVNEAIKFFPIYFNENNSIELRPSELNEEINLNDKCMAVVNYESFEKFLPFIRHSAVNF